MHRIGKKLRPKQRHGRRRILLKLGISNQKFKNPEIFGSAAAPARLAQMIDDIEGMIRFVFTSYTFVLWYVNC